ncbi:hypothetical protein NLG97_g10955 [Lecanicillium saksenae]|uniref:Uncharacterized protein n=1 Tax=Lecanicillium saksenae TaxID=468837 RepID=A0ACC1QD47_9HYPO|nr:hypothetical protein NLG97_g10955 [Lecanicillium saksenae]
MPGIPARAAACKTLREHQSPEPCLSLASYQLLVLGVAEDQQGLGIGGRLIREGMALAAADGLPVFVTGEGRGMHIYMHYGFQEVRGSWRGFDKEARMLESRGEEEGWKEENGGLEARQMVWVPEGASVEVKGEVYHGK